MLIEALIASVIMGAMALVFASLMSSYVTESKSLTQKMDIMDLQQGLIGALSNAGVCSCTLNASTNTTDASKLVFNSNSASTINLTNIYSACPTGTNPTPAVTVSKLVPGSNTVTVKSITLTQPQLTSATSGSYQATLTVNFDQSKLVTPRKSVNLPVNISADISNASQAKITGCAYGAPPAAFPGSGSGPAPASSGLQVYNNCQLEPTQTCPTGKVVKDCYGARTTQSTAMMGSMPPTYYQSFSFSLDKGIAGTQKAYNGTLLQVCDVSSDPKNPIPVGDAVYECCDP
jgi:hypothetical protein